MYQNVEFTCMECEKEFKADWTFGFDVQCPHCKTWFETDYDEGEDGWYGPWLTNKVGEPIK